MSDLAISVSVEGLDLTAWEPTFRAGLAEAPAELGMALNTVIAVGALGARRGGAVKVTGAGPGAKDNGLQVLGLVIAALTLAVASAQLSLGGQPDDPPAQSFTCRIEGPQGVRELVITGAAIPSEHVLLECLKGTGTPTKVRAVPPKKPG